MTEPRTSREALTAAEIEEIQRREPSERYARDGWHDRITLTVEERDKLCELAALRASGGETPPASPLSLTIDPNAPPLSLVVDAAPWTHPCVTCGGDGGHQEHCPGSPPASAPQETLTKLRAILDIEGEYARPAPPDEHCEYWHSAGMYHMKLRVLECLGWPPFAPSSVAVETPAPPPWLPPTCSTCLHWLPEDRALHVRAQCNMGVSGATAEKASHHPYPITRRDFGCVLYAPLPAPPAPPAPAVEEK